MRTDQSLHTATYIGIRVGGLSYTGVSGVALDSSKHGFNLRLHPLTTELELLLL